MIATDCKFVVDKPGSIQGYTHYKIMADGMVWVGEFSLTIQPDEHNEHTIALSDFEVWEPYRGQGFGSQAIKFMAAVALSKKCNEIKLHVRGNNEGAIRLYKRHGFVTTYTSSVRHIPDYIMGNEVVNTMFLKLNKGK